MSHRNGLDRRSFLRNAGMAVLVGTVAPTSARAVSTSSEGADNTYDFDEIYNRIGTNCKRWDREIDEFGDIEVGMGIADLDFRAAPCITKALAKRCEHKNWGYPYSQPGTVSMIVRLHYASGATEDHPLLNGAHFADYVRKYNVPNSTLALTLGPHQIRYLSIEPKSQTTIERIEFIKGEDNTAPIVMAVTIEKLSTGD